MRTLWISPFRRMISHRSDRVGYLTRAGLLTVVAAVAALVVGVGLPAGALA